MKGRGQFDPRPLNKKLPTKSLTLLGLMLPTNIYFASVNDSVLYPKLRLIVYGFKTLLELF